MPVLGVCMEGSLVLVAGWMMLPVVLAARDRAVVEDSQNQPVMVAANRGPKEVAVAGVEM